MFFLGKLQSISELGFFVHSSQSNKLARSNYNNQFLSVNFMEIQTQPSEAGQTWETIRKRARKLEGELDVKLAAFAKLCLKYDGHETPLAKETLQMKSQELDRLLVELEEVNASMQHVKGNADSRGHALGRHQEILSAYIQEHDRLKESISSVMDRREALDVQSETAPLMGVQIQGATGTLLRERATIHNASTGIDEIITHATAISDDIKSQGSLFGRTSNKLIEVTAKYPVVNGLLRSIARRKSRDAIILAVVIASCLAITIAYMIFR